MGYPGSKGPAAESVDSPSQIRERNDDRTDDQHGVDCKTEDDKHDGRYVPDYILEEILIRLTAKFVFQSKCACKKWLSLTSTPSFIRSYFLHWQERFENSSTTRPWTLLYRSTCDDLSSQISEERKLPHVYSLESPSPSLSVVSCLPHGSRMQIIAESSGLLLCYQTAANKFYVCNPITNQWVVLPDIPGGRNLVRPRSRLTFPSMLSESRRNVKNQALATVVEDGLVTRYKVVVPQGFLDLSVFSSDVGIWITFTPAFNPPTPLNSNCLSEPVAVDGILYWPDHLRGLLLAYDPFGENNTNVRVLSLPRAHFGDVHSRMCGVSGGFLRYHELHEMDGIGAFRIWELEYLSGTWSVKHECSWNDVWSYDEDLTATMTEMARARAIYFAPLAFHPYDPDAIFMHNGKYIVSYSFEKRRLDVVHDPHTCLPELAWPTEQSWFNVMTFPLPLWPSPVPETACDATGAV